MAWYNNLINVRKLFGSTFYSMRNNYLLGSKAPIWIDTNNLLNIYETIPEVRLVIDYKATMFSNMKIKLFDQNGEEVLEHEALNLLKNPNPLQTQNEFLSQYVVNKSIYGNAFINKLQATTTSFPGVMYVLPSEFMKINPTGKIFKQSEINEIIKDYELEYSGYVEKYLPEEILHKNDIATNDYLASGSRLLPLKMPISNIEGAYKSRNILINERGAIGILSNSGKDGDGGIPLNPKEKEQIQKDYSQSYGINEGQKRVIISNSSLNWQPMTFPTKDLMLFEEITEDFNKIVDAYGLNENIFSNKQGSTYENYKQGLKGAYENTIIPEANDLMYGLNKFLGLKDQGLKLVADFTHLPVMAEDELSKEQTEKTKAEKLGILLNLDAINVNDIRTEFNMDSLPMQETTQVIPGQGADTIEGGDKEVQDANAQAQAGLRGSVGGVQGILQIQTSLSQGLITRPSALSILMTIYGFDEQTANEILG